MSAAAAPPAPPSPGLAAAAGVHGVQAPAAAQPPTPRRKQRRSHTAKKASHTPATPAHAPPRQEARLDKTLADLAARREEKRVEIRDNTEGASRNFIANQDQHDREIAVLLRSAKDQHQAIHRQQQVNQNMPNHAAMHANPWTLGITKRPFWKGNHLKGGKRKRRHSRKKRRRTRRKRRHSRKKRRRTRRKRRHSRKKRRRRRGGGGPSNLPRKVGDPAHKQWAATSQNPSRLGPFQEYHLDERGNPVAGPAARKKRTKSATKLGKTKGGRRRRR